MEAQIPLKFKVRGQAMRIRQEDKALVDDLRAKMIPEEEIRRIVLERQANDTATEQE